MSPLSRPAASQTVCRERGASLVEYALIVALVVVTLVPVVAMIGDRSQSYQSRTATDIGGDPVELPNTTPTTASSNDPAGVPATAAPGGGN